MDSKIKELAERAGFPMWEDKEWNLGKFIDWSCDVRSITYDEELIKFYELVREQLLDELREGDEE